MSWSEDGRSVMFSTYFFNEQDQVVERWWRYELTGDQVFALAPPFDISPQIWHELEAVHESLLPVGAVSPSRQYLVFTRAPAEYLPSSTSNRPELPPMELWIARTDGSDAIKIGGPYPGCQTIGEVIWFEHETRVIVSCGYEGPYGLFLAATDGSEFMTLGELTGIEVGVGFAGTALSPDESTLAFTDPSGTLDLVALGGRQIHCIAFGLGPNWSLDSRRLYYLKGNDETFSTISGIWMYDLDRQTEMEIISLPVYSSDGQEIRIYAGAGVFAVSPQERALVFQSQGLWLATWSP